MLTRARWSTAVQLATVLTIAVVGSAHADTIAPPSPTPNAVAAYSSAHKVSQGEAVARLALQARLWDIGDQAKLALASSFGGVYFDNAEGTFKVLTTNARAPGVAVLEEYLRQRDAITQARIVGTSLSLASLETARDAVRRRLDLDGLRTADAIVGIDLTRGAVNVEVASPRVTHVREVDLEGAAANATGGRRVEVRTQDAGRDSLIVPETWCSYPHCTKPLHAGVQLQSQNPSPPSGCSIAGHASSSGGRTFVITAAHCGSLNSWWQAHHPVSSWNTVGQMAFRAGGSGGDIALVETKAIHAGGFWYPGTSWSNPLLAAWSEGLHDYTIDNAVSPVPGLFVGWGGFTSYGFATTSTTNVDVAYNGYLHMSELLMNQGCASGGTSGGAVWNTHVIYGVISAGDCSRVWITDIKRVYFNWGIYIAT